MNFRTAAVPCLLISGLLGGCLSSGQRGDPQERAAWELARLGAEPYLKPDGSLDPAYLLGANMPITGENKNRPIFYPNLLKGRTR